MKKRLISLVLLSFLCFSLAVPALAAKGGEYVLDSAGLMTDTQCDELNAMAEEISEEYECGLYIMTVYDHRELGDDDVFEATWQTYHRLELGYGKECDGVILLLSMRRRDYALFFVYYAFIIFIIRIFKVECFL